jgi:hypothetical protein
MNKHGKYFEHLREKLLKLSHAESKKEYLYWTANS